MPVDTAIEIIERHLSSRSTKYDECEIDFFGGEPFLNFPLIKQVCEYVWSKEWEKPYVFFATTNGTLIHGEIQDWLYKNRERFYVSLSLDGTQEMHDHNRSKSFSKIDIDFFKNTWRNLSVKMTISQETLPSLAEGVIFLHSLGFEIQNNLAFGINWSDSINEKTLSCEMNKLIEYYLENPDIKPCSFMDVKIEYCNRPARKWCGVGTQMVAFDVDGVDYPCQSFLPMSIGKEKAKFSRTFDFNSFENLLDPKCKDCILQSICPTCYGSNYSANNNLASKDNDLCRLTKLQALACSYLKAKKILMRRETAKLGGEDYRIVKSAMQIQSGLSF
jgi:radical SAM protein with 4Fe4S-binding SPASM domain